MFLFLKIEKVKPEELVQERKEPLKDEEVPSGVDGVEITRREPMETDTQKTRAQRRSDERLRMLRRMT